MKASVPVGPFIAGELRALFAGEENQGVLGELGVVEEFEEFAELGIHVSDLGEVGREALAGFGSVGEVGWEFNFLWRIGRGIAHDPGDVWFGESDDEAERLFIVTGDEGFGASEIVRAGGIANTAGIETGDFFEGVRGFWFDVSLSCESDAVTQCSKKMGKAFRAGASGAMIPGAAVSERVTAGVEFGPTRCTHCHAEKGLFKYESLFRERVDVRSFGVLSAIDREVGIGAVVADDEEDVGWIFFG